QTLLSRALSRASDGRNDAGFWLACQLRDNRYSLCEAESVLRQFAKLCPAGGHAYTEDEALASLESAYSSPARRPGSNATKDCEPEPAAHGEAGAGASSGAAGSSRNGTTNQRTYDVGPFRLVTDRARKMPGGNTRVPVTAFMGADVVLVFILS